LTFLTKGKKKSKNNMGWFAWLKNCFRKPENGFSAVNFTNDFSDGTTGLISGEENAAFAGQVNRKVWIWTARAYLHPGIVYSASLVAFLIWCFFSLFGISDGVFDIGENTIASEFPVVIVLGSSPNWIDVLTFVSIAGCFVVTLLQMIQGKRSDTPFVSNQICSAFVFAMNAAVAWEAYHKNHENAAIIASVSLLLTIAVYWFRRTAHFIHMWFSANWKDIAKAHGATTFKFVMHQLPIEFSHPEPIDDMEFALTEVPLKFLLLWLIQNVPYRWFIYSMATYNNQVFDGTISIENILYGFMISLTIMTLIFNVLLRYDGIFGFFVGLYQLLLAFDMAKTTHNLSYGPSLAGYIMGGGLMIISLVIIMKSYENYRDEYFVMENKKGADPSLYGQSLLNRRINSYDYKEKTKWFGK
jgi:hypothetical protein